MNTQRIGVYQYLETACKAYNSLAPKVAAMVTDIIATSLPKVTVKHIGSTAVKGCAGKGIIDLMVLYPEGELESVKTRLDELGFQRQTTRYPFPEYRPMLVGSISYEGEIFQLHVHVIGKDKPEVVELIKFRDALRADSKLLICYVLLKKTILENGITDPIEYCIAKEGFIKKVICL